VRPAHFKSDDLPRCVNTTVRPSRCVDDNALAGNGLDRLLQSLLNSPFTLSLTLETTKIGAVILDQSSVPPQVHPFSPATVLKESDSLVRGPIFPR